MSHVIGRGRYGRETYPRAPGTVANAEFAEEAQFADLARARNLNWLQGDGVDIVLDVGTPNMQIDSAQPINPMVDGVERILHVYGQFWLRTDAAFVANGRLDATIDGTFGARTTTGFALITSVNIFAGEEYEWAIPFDLLFNSGAANAAAQTLSLTLAIAAFPAAGTITVRMNKPIANAELIVPTIGTFAP